MNKKKKSETDSEITLLTIHPVRLKIYSPSAALNVISYEESFQLSSVLEGKVLTCISEKKVLEGISEKQKFSISTDLKMLEPTRDASFKWRQILLK